MPKPILIAVFFHKRVSVGLALLIEFIFTYANRLADRSLFKIERVHCGSGNIYLSGDMSLHVTTLTDESNGYLIIPPIEGPIEHFEIFHDETDFIRRNFANGMVIAASCLGAFLSAGAGILDRKEATTHWRWGEYAVNCFPEVKWNIRAMLCDEESVITSGGLLSVIDLSLYIIGKSCSPDFVHQLGQGLLADSVRQKQSVYAQSLALPPKDNDRFSHLEQEIQRRLNLPFHVREMASFCHMSLRHFHRTFIDNYGVTPNKYLQLKRIEAAKGLLSDLNKSIEEVGEQCGFSDVAFFRTIFSRETGFTPSQYRKRISK